MRALWSVRLAGVSISLADIDFRFVKIWSKCPPSLWVMMSSLKHGLILNCFRISRIRFIWKLKSPHTITREFLNYPNILCYIIYFSWFIVCNTLSLLYGARYTEIIWMGVDWNSVVVQRIASLKCMIFLGLFPVVSTATPPVLASAV